MEKLRFCLVGVGSIGRRHLRLLHDRGDLRLSVVEPLDESYQRVCSEIGVFPRYASLEQAMAEEKPDAVVICTPHGAHAGLAIQALDAGAHVFCEKPMSDNLEECVAMLHAARRSEKVFSVGFMYRFDPFILKVKEILDSGRIGRLLHYSSRFATYNTLLCSVTRHQAHTPYALVMDCIHDTDLLCWFAGSVPDYAYSSAYQAGDLELSSSPNFIDTVYRWESGKLGAHTHFNYVQHPQVHTLEIAGERGYILGDFMRPSVTVATADGQMETLTIQRTFDDVYRAEWQSFIEAVRGVHAPENPAESAIFSTLLMQAQKESGMRCREVSVREIAGRCGFSY